MQDRLEGRDALAEIVTVPEAARIIGRSTRRVEQYAVEGRLRARQTEDGTWLVERGSLEAFAHPLPVGRPRTW